MTRMEAIAEQYRSLPRCKTNKVPFLRKIDAEIEASWKENQRPEYGRDVVCRVYQCPSCGAWHIGRRG